MAGAPRKTKQKQAVYEALTQLDHPTATQVYEYVHSQNPTLSRGTVFRVLGGFAANGQVRKVTLEGSDARFDPHPFHRDEEEVRRASIQIAHHDEVVAG